ncbi:hypothetical protein CONPUDRAFT_157217 [Coniophora puteana RWD-64-598 SS2]|uniref:Uncharacterized protein n=1 Tax=Coniophora puteana (strain RWD-64-598) TaxID=741705 RepID=A0A5M3MFW6_CONPW|nr:uncharacterized protein CONPUDRAFT_157217 [Coniophora puteana RWD-64-598 SS2]EIW78053.1 hypothetical protein CONPUDRAFT_157217 [Coniophora puteana RWD-64-598 SS2]
MAQSWPLLEELSFPPLEKAERLTLAFSFDNVLTIAKTFPRIETLALPYNSGSLSFSNAVQGQEIRERSRTLRILMIYHINIDNLAPAGVVLAHSFPNIVRAAAGIFGLIIEISDVLTARVRKLHVDVYGKADTWTVDALAKRVEPIFDRKAADTRAREPRRHFELQVSWEGAALPNIPTNLRYPYYCEAVLWIND